LEHPANGTPTDRLHLYDMAGGDGVLQNALKGAEIISNVKCWGKLGN